MNELLQLINESDINEYTITKQELIDIILRTKEKCRPIPAIYRAIKNQLKLK